MVQMASTNKLLEEKGGMSGLTERFDAICERMAAALARSGRKAGDAVQLVAVSKLHGAGAVAELAEHWAAHTGAGRPVFGESYMQEARDKMPEAGGLLAGRGIAPPEWHFIGHLQSRKAKDVAGRFSLIHSVDSAKLALALGKAWQSRVEAAPLGLDDAAPGPQPVLVQVNVGREEQKSGVDPDKLEPLILEIASMPELGLQGLMCIPPLADIGEASRPYFTVLRELRDTMESRCGIALPQLSMGMSDDFEAAIEEGATLIRIGTDIFGARN